MNNNNQTQENPFDAVESVASAEGKAGVKPIHKIRLGRVTAAIWQREGKTGMSRFSVTLGRSYKTEEGFRDTSRLDDVDLAFGARLLQMAQEWIIAQPAK